MKEIKELKTKLINLDEITPYENNAKEHPDWQIAQIKNSIEQFGFNDPIAVNENMGIIEGHGRYLAAKELGLKEVPCIILSGMTADEERAYIIAHNKLTMNTGFDLEVLEYELNALKVEDFDLSLTGFENIEIDDILNSDEINALNSISEDGYSSLADDIKEGAEIFTISFNFPIDKKQDIENLIKERGKEYFVNLIIEELENSEVY